MQVLTHSNESSGTTVLDDGTKLHWTEGFSDTVIIHPDGRREVVGWMDAEKHPMADVIIEPDTSHMRPMTAEEEAEHEQAMYG